MAASDESAGAAGNSFLQGLQSAFNAGKELSLEGLSLAQSTGRELQSPLNAIFGDRLERMGSPLALQMQLLIAAANDGSKPGEFAFKAIDLESDALKQAFNPQKPPDRVCIFIHGLGSSERTWEVRRAGNRKKAGERRKQSASAAGSQTPEQKAESSKATDNPAKAKQLSQTDSYTRLLDRDTGHACFYLRYNTGRHISTNGRELADLLNRFAKVYPVKLREINLIGHSMGGLVSRSAAYYGKQRRYGWIKLLARNMLLGSPLLGAHQEQIGKLTTDVLNAIPLPGTRITAHFLDFRSDGIQDLGYGYLRDEDWNDAGAERGPGGALKNRRSPAPLLKKTRYFLVVGSLSKDPESIVGGFLGDGIVSRWSARGASGGDRESYEEYGATSADDSKNSKVVAHEIAGLNHTAIPGDPRVYRKLRDWLREI